MAEKNNETSCRQSLAEAFRALSDNAVKAGWSECEVVLALADLAEERVIEMSAKAIIEGSTYPHQFGFASGRKS